MSKCGKIDEKYLKTWMNYDFHEKTKLYKWPFLILHIYLLTLICCNSILAFEQILTYLHDNFD